MAYINLREVLNSDRNKTKTFPTFAPHPVVEQIVYNHQSGKLVLTLTNKKKKTCKILLVIQLLEVFQGRKAECLQSRSIEYKYVWWINFHIDHR